MVEWPAVYEWARLALGWASMILLGILGLTVVFGGIIVAGLLWHTRRAQRQRPYPPIAETPEQRRWRKTRERDQGSSDATEVIHRYIDNGA